MPAVPVGCRVKLAAVLYESLPYEAHSEVFHIGFQKCS